MKVAPWAPFGARVIWMLHPINRGRQAAAKGSINSRNQSCYRMFLVPIITKTDE
jgi:hypothetical protein